MDPRVGLRTGRGARCVVTGGTPEQRYATVGWMLRRTFAPPCCVEPPPDDSWVLVADCRTWNPWRVEVPCAQCMRGTCESGPARDQILREMIAKQHRRVRTRKGQQARVVIIDESTRAQEHIVWDSELMNLVRHAHHLGITLVVVAPTLDDLPVDVQEQAFECKCALLGAPGTMRQISHASV